MYPKFRPDRGSKLVLKLQECGRMCVMQTTTAIALPFAAQTKLRFRRKCAYLEPANPYTDPFVIAACRKQPSTVSISLAVVDSVPFLRRWFTRQLHLPTRTWTARGRRGQEL